MWTPRQLSLKRLLLAHEFAFLLLVVVTGLLAGASAYFWQETAAESVRLNQLTYTAQQVRSDLFRQIKEIMFARLTQNMDGLNRYGDYSRRIDRHFNSLRRLAANHREDEAIQMMQHAYRVLQNDMNRVFADPYVVITDLPVRVLDPRYEKALVGDFDDAIGRFEIVVQGEQQRLDRTLERWTRYAPVLLPVPLVLAVLLIAIARRWLQRGFVLPVQAIMSGARRISRGDLHHVIDRQGVEEMADLALAINQMADEIARSRDAQIENEKNIALGALVPVVAHNIRNPLASIRASAQLLDHADDPGEVRDIRKAIVDTVDRLGRWVSALVSYLHPLKPQPVRRRPAALMEAALELLKPRLAEKNMTVERGAWDADIEVAVDPDLMEQALYGLMANAVDASPEGSVLTVEACAADAERFRLVIADQGVGMPFQPEPTGLTPGPTTKRFGTGLGIPVAFKVCKAHGWKLEFEKGNNGGTRVTLTAPMKEPAARDFRA